MNSEDKQIRDILQEYHDTLDIGRATRAIKNLFQGLSLYGEDIPLECYNCGEDIRPFSKDKTVKLHFDPGTQDTRVTPGEPAAAYLECEKCTNGGVV
jgi:hypothetical protein